MTFVKIVLRDLDINFQVQIFEEDIMTSKCWKKNANIIVAIGYEVRYSSSNCVTANVVHHNLDLNNQGHEFGNVNLWQTVS